MRAEEWLVGWLVIEPVVRVCGGGATCTQDEKSQTAARSLSLSLSHPAIPGCPMRCSGSSTTPCDEAADMSQWECVI